jgi:hypothetical protein
MARYSRALDAKPSKGPWEDAKVAWITDSVADVPQLLAEIERLTTASCGAARWSAEAAEEGRELIGTVSDRVNSYGERGRSSMPITLDEAAALLIIASDHLERHRG